MKIKTIFLLMGVVCMVKTGFSQPAHKGFEHLPSGIYFKIHKQASGSKAQPGDHIEMNLEMMTDSGFVVFNTLELNGAPVHYKVQAPAFNGDIMEGLMMLGQGDSATFIIAADSVYRDDFYPEKVYSGSWLFYHVSIDSRKTNEEYEAEIAQMKAEQLAKDQDTLQSYFKKNEINDLASTPGGVQYVIHKDGKGENAIAGQDVSVHYIGRLLDGSEFDNSFKRMEPFEFVLGEGHVIDGWEEVIPFLNEGDSATIYLPSGLAYGERGAGGVIPPNAILIFDILIEGISNKTIKKAEDQKIIKAHIQQNNLSAFRSSGGIFYEISKQGTGSMAASGARVLVRYSISDLEGNSFVKNESVDTPAGDGLPFKGLDEAIRLIPAGSEAILYIPSTLGYGEAGMEGLIPGDTILKVTIHGLELVEQEE